LAASVPSEVSKGLQRQHDDSFGISVTGQFQVLTAYHRPE
jgi:hypothetical protein